MKIRGVISTGKSPLRLVKTQCTITSAKVVSSGVPQSSRIVEATITCSGNLLHFIDLNAAITQDTPPAIACALPVQYLLRICQVRK